MLEINRYEDEQICVTKDLTININLIKKHYLYLRYINILSTNLKMDIYCELYILS